MEALFHPDARAELLDAATYYEERADQLGRQFIDEAHRVVDLLAGSPGLGAPVTGEPGLRRWRLRRFRTTWFTASRGSSFTCWLWRTSVAARDTG